MHLFETLRYDESGAERPEFVLNREPWRNAQILIAGENFGCGSSREYAPEALKRRKIAAIIAPSFARIFFRNAINLGIPLYTSREISETISDGDIVELDLEASRLIAGERQYSLPPLPDFMAEILKAGGIVPYVRQHGRFPSQ